MALDGTVGMFDPDWSLCQMDKGRMGAPLKPDAYWNSWPSVALGRALGLVPNWLSPDGKRLVMSYETAQRRSSHWGDKQTGSSAHTLASHVVVPLMWAEPGERPTKGRASMSTHPGFMLDFQTLW